MSLDLITAPSIYPLELEEVAEHLRLSESETEARIRDLNRLIAEATEFAEDLTWRAFITQTWNYYPEKWPTDRYICLPRPPLQTVTEICYTVDGASAETAFTSFKTDNVSEPGRVILNTNATWPTVVLAPVKPIRIKYVAGYGAEREDVPERIRQAMLLHILENHSGASMTETIVNILRNYRIRNWQYGS